MSDALAALLRTPADQIERPKAIPPGTYTGILKSHEFGRSKNKGTPQVTYQVALTGAEADVDQEKLQGVDLSKKTLRTTFYLTPEAQYRLIDLAAACDIATSGVSLGEIIDALDGTNVLLDVTERRSEDGKDIYNDVNKVHAVS